ncbi:MAG: hypothetical protein J0L51_07255 [Rhizobiales bacterium]|nr:hypothetical protein [Hyphomicrobiales bacterium]
MNALTPSPEPICRLSMRNIVEIAAQFFEMSVVDILSQRRDARIVRARSVAMFAARTLLPRSYPEIGRAIGNRDHTTVLHACQSVERQMQESDEYAALVGEFLTICRGAAPIGPPDTDPYDMALKVLNRPGLATNVSINTIRDFAAIISASIANAADKSAAEELEAHRAAFNAIVPALGEFVLAFRAVNAASPRAEARATAQLEAASVALISAFQQHFKLQGAKT